MEYKTIVLICQKATSEKSSIMCVKGIRFDSLFYFINTMQLNIVRTQNMAVLTGLNPCSRVIKVLLMHKYDMDLYISSAKMDRSQYLCALSSGLFLRSASL